MYHPKKTPTASNNEGFQKVSFSVTANIEAPPPSQDGGWIRSSDCFSKDTTHKRNLNGFEAIGTVADRVVRKLAR